MTSLKKIFVFTLLLAFWPCTYLFSCYLALGEVNHLTVHELYNFIPLGVISGLTVILPLWSRRYNHCLLWGLAGFIVAAPVAYFASLYGADSGSMAFSDFSGKLASTDSHVYWLQGG